MKSRQPLNTVRELWHIHGADAYVIRFQPDQRLDALMVLDNWQRKSIITNQQFREYHAEIVAKTWSYV